MFAVYLHPCTLSATKHYYLVVPQKPTCCLPDTDYIMLFSEKVGIKSFILLENSHGCLFLFFKKSKICKKMKVCLEILQIFTANFSSNLL